MTVEASSCESKLCTFAKFSVGQRSEDPQRRPRSMKEGANFLINISMSTHFLPWFLFGSSSVDIILQPHIHSQTLSSMWQPLSLVPYCSGVSSGKSIETERQHLLGYAANYHNVP